MALEGRSQTHNTISEAQLNSSNEVIYASRAPSRLISALQQQTNVVTFQPHSPSSPHIPSSANQDLQVTKHSFLLEPQEQNISPPRTRPLQVGDSVCIPQTAHIQDYTSVPVNHGTSPGRNFLDNALVWFARPCRGFSVTTTWSLLSSISRRQRLHSIESLLLGCGWDVNSHEAVAKWGVIFVDTNGPAGKEWKGHILKTIEERRLALPFGQPRKPIWIFDVKSWNFERDDIESYALYRLS